MGTKKNSVVLQVFGLVMLIALILSNLANLLFTVALTIEQIGSPWGSGTNMEMLVLMPFMIELLCLPILAAGIVYFVLHAFRSSHKGILIANISTYALLISQYVLTHLFIWF